MSLQKMPEIPIKIDNYEVVQDKNGIAIHYILKNNNYDIYLVLNEYDYLIWNSINGSHTTEQINMLFYEEFNRIGIDYIEKFIVLLGEKGFLVNYDFDPSSVKYKQKLLQYKIPLKNVDRFFISFYRLVGRFLFAKPTLFFYLLVAVVGLSLYFTTPHRSLFMKGTYLNIVLLYTAVLLPVFLHELSHALVCLHYNRTVKDAGIMLYMLMPVFYVNTSDIWMGKKKARLLVSMAGPMCDIFVGSLLFIFYSLTRDSPVSIIFYQGAVLSYIRAIFNLNPLLKWDGYYCLMDLLGIYNLQERSFGFVRRGMLPKLRNRMRLSIEEIKFILYGLVSMGYMAYFFYRLFFRNIKFWTNFDAAHLNQQVIMDMVFIIPFLFIPVRQIKRMFSTQINNRRKLNGEVEYDRKF